MNKRVWYKPSTWLQPKAETGQIIDPIAHYNLSVRSIGSVSFNGEVNPGQAGPIVDYKLDFQSLRARSHQAMLESDIAQVGMKRLVRWVIGKGMKLQSEPTVEVLTDEGITFDKKKFTKSFESRFNLWRKQKSSDYAGMKNLNQLSDEAENNAGVGGDVLVVLRVIKGELKIQLIDGAHVQSPDYGSEWFPKELPSGHLIIDGVEINARREHVAFYVKVYAVDATMPNLFKYEFKRIEARGNKSGILMAYLYYGSEFRINNVRGMPIMAACFEKLNNLDLYSEATLKQAQESAKVDYQVVHDKEARGVAPWAQSTVDSYNGVGASENGNLPVTDDGEQLMKTTHVTGIGTAYNNSPGSKIEMLENKNPLYFKDFFTTHRDVFFAVIEIPPNVAMSKYDDSYSASRAAVMDWAHTLIVKRERHYIGFLKPIVDLWLELEILQNKIQAPGYLLARNQDNTVVIEAYRNVRFVGANVPHIDPKKEVEAARLMAGKAGENLPFDDLENIIERLGSGGDAQEILQQFSEELAESKRLGIKPEPVLQQVQKETTKNNPVKKKKKPA